MRQDLPREWRNNMSGRKKQTEDLLIEIRAKALELKAVINDYMEQEINDDGNSRLWLQLSDAVYVYRVAEKKLKGT